MIKQNIVFVENKAGSLKRVTNMLANNDINIYGFACFDAPEFAIFRMICNDPDKAEIILNQSGYMNRITQAIVVDMKDQVGGLDELLKVLADSKPGLYLYFFPQEGSDTGCYPSLRRYHSDRECIEKQWIQGLYFRRRTGKINNQSTESSLQKIMRFYRHM